MDDEYTKRHFGSPPPPDVLSRIDVSCHGEAVEAIARPTRGLDKDGIVQVIDDYLESIKGGRVPVRIETGQVTTDGHNLIMSVPIRPEGVLTLLEEAVHHVAGLHKREDLTSAEVFASKIQNELLTYLQPMFEFQNSHLVVNVSIEIGRAHV